MLSMLFSIGITQAFAAEDDAPTSQKEVHGSIAPVSEEYLEYLRSGKTQNGRVPSALDLSYLGKRYTESAINACAILPESYDLRDYGLVSAVQDQGIYGTCWAFGALGSAESALMKKQLSLVDFSKKHLAWFSMRGGQEEEEFFRINYQQRVNVSPYMFGGHDIKALATLAAWKGPIASSKLPYDSFDDDPDESLRYEADFHLQDCVYMYGYNPIFSVLHPEADMPSTDLVKQLIMENGAYEIAYCSADVGSEYYNEETFAIHHDEKVSADHSNLIVGWDDHFAKENFASGHRPKNDGAWLVRNSWGSSWGDCGYFWLSYEDKSIKMQGSSYTFEDNDNYAKNYQYDMIGWSVSAAADDFIDVEDASKTAYISNIFTAKENEQLEAVAFYTTDVGTAYEISVYTDVEDGNPVSGTLAYFGQEGVEEYCGYHTIVLDSAVALDAGKNFSVVVKLTNPEYAYPIATEGVTMFDGDAEPEYLGNGGESYYSADGVNWTDIVELGKYAINASNASKYWVYTSNVCLKAFTNPLPESGEAIGNVDFSLFAGEVALGSKLELSGAANIHYTVTPLDGAEGAVTKYTEPIIISEPCTVTAWGVVGNKIGNKVSKTFTQQVSCLTDFIIKSSLDGYITQIDLNSEDSKLYFDYIDYRLKLYLCGKDEITINGTSISSNKWLDEISLKEGTNDITIETEGNGKESRKYTFSLYRSPLNYDYTAETVSFDESRFTVTDEDGKALKSGDKVTPYVTVADEEEPKYLIVTDKETKESETLSVGQRPNLSDCEIDYYNEKTVYMFNSNTYVSDTQDMSDAEDISNDYYQVEPGKTVYIKRKATSFRFASEVYPLVTPARPDTPKATVKEIGADYIVLSKIENGEYRILQGDEWSEWQTENSFTGLALDTEYTVEVRIAATDESFASLADSVSAKTLTGAKVKVMYTAFGHTVREKELFFPEGKTVYYPDTSLTELGYHFSEDDRKNGKTVTVKNAGGVLTPETSEIVFEVSADVTPSDYTYTVNYWTEDGKILTSEAFAFTHTEALAVSEIAVPAGYEQDGLIQPAAGTVATLTYYNDKWVVQGKEINLKVKKIFSGGGSSSGGSTAHAVSTAETTNGTVSVSPQNAAKDATVTVTTTPDKGWTLETLTVLDKNGEEVELCTVVLGEKYTFKMPAGGVTVQASFMEDNTMLNYFVDVSASDYFYDAVLWAAEKGIAAGMDDSHFGPDAHCTRAQIVTFLWRAAGSPEATTDQAFSDVAADSYYAKAVTWAAANGITGGTGDGKFSPDAVCTRAQAVAFLARALHAKAESKAEFRDVSADAYYADAVAWAAENGITVGIGGGLFGSDYSCTRAQIVTFLQRAMAA